MDGLTETERRARDIALRYGDLAGEALLRPLIETEFGGRIALVSSFGVEAAVLLHMVAGIDRGLPVVFIDTGKHFAETLRYRDALIAALGLTDVRVAAPDARQIAARDPHGTLSRANPETCCVLRKVEPLAAALADFEAWISGRKRYQGGLRQALPTIEAADGRIKVNPLATWNAADIAAEFAARRLPRHPLLADGFPSIGCAPCTVRAAGGEADPRSGRWPGTAKTECGIHLGFRPNAGPSIATSTAIPAP
ncbi:MAG TPA: phosphoadenylyl-sulfate reductase [Stellaceae bacterium]|nr:phosphoadenylyl-sulfate reductase [Stellaceae bacterium]